MSIYRQVFDDLENAERTVQRYGLETESYEFSFGDTSIRGKTLEHVQDRLPPDTRSVRVDVYLQRKAGEAPMDRLVYRYDKEGKWGYISLGSTDRKILDNIIEDLEN